MKMKNILLLAAIPVGMLVFANTTPPPTIQTDIVPDYCKSQESRKKCKELLDDYEYDAAKSTKITYKPEKTQEREIEVPLFFGEKYKFVFSTEGIPQPIDIEIYDKKKTSKKRTLLYSNKDIKEDASKTEFEFLPEKSKKMYVNYTIPPSSDSLKKGCVIFVVGYKSKFKKE